MTYIYFYYQRTAWHICPIPQASEASLTSNDEGFKKKKSTECIKSTEQVGSENLFAFLSSSDSLRSYKRGFKQQQIDATDKPEITSMVFEKKSIIIKLYERKWYPNSAKLYDVIQDVVASMRMPINTSHYLLQLILIRRKGISIFYGYPSKILSDFY